MSNEALTIKQPLNKKQKYFKWCLIVIGIILVVLLIFFNGIYPYFPMNINRLIGNENEQVITENVQKIFQAYTKCDSNVYLIESKKDSQYSYITGRENEVKELLYNGGKLIKISAKQNKEQDIPSEIYAIIRVLLYLKNNSINITGVQYIYFLGIVPLEQHQIVISYKTFNELYNQFYNSDSSDKDNTKILADKWIEKTEYIKSKSGKPIIN